MVKILTSHTKAKVAQLVSNSKTNELMLQVIVKQWEKHKHLMKMISDILMYMDKVYCKNEHRPLVYNMGLIVFRDTVNLPSVDICAYARLVNVHAC